MGPFQDDSESVFLSRRPNADCGRVRLGPFQIADKRERAKMVQVRHQSYFQRFHVLYTTLSFTKGQEYITADGTNFDKTGTNFKDYAFLYDFIFVILHFNCKITKIRKCNGSIRPANSGVSPPPVFSVPSQRLENAFPPGKDRSDASDGTSHIPAVPCPKPARD
jgi:hypothetical protein